MQHFLQSVNHGRLVFLLRNELDEEFAEFIGWDVADWDMDEWGEDAIGMDTEHTLERRFAMNPERVDVVEGVERFSADESFVRHHELEFARVARDEEVADNADQDKDDRHERAIGEDGVRDDEGEEDGRDHQSARVRPDMDVFRSVP